MTALEERLGHSFRNRALLETAVTHSSYANENRASGIVCNERLEFLGDSVLGVTVADFQYRHFPDMPEGRMTRVRTIETPSFTDYKTALQELVQRQSGQVLSYELVGEEGPDHAKTFRMQVCLNGEPVGLGTGRTKKEAEQTAAASALEALRK